MFHEQWILKKIKLFDFFSAMRRMVCSELIQRSRLFEFLFRLQKLIVYPLRLPLKFHLKFKFFALQLLIFDMTHRLFVHHLHSLSICSSNFQYLLSMTLLPLLQVELLLDQIILFLLEIFFGFNLIDSFQQSLIVLLFACANFSRLTPFHIGAQLGKV